MNWWKEILQIANCHDWQAIALCCSSFCLEKRYVWSRILWALLWRARGSTFPFSILEMIYRCFTLLVCLAPLYLILQLVVAFQRFRTSNCIPSVLVISFTRRIGIDFLETSYWIYAPTICILAWLGTSLNTIFVLGASNELHLRVAGRQEFRMFFRWWMPRSVKTPCDIFYWTC